MSIRTEDKGMSDSYLLTSDNLSGGVLIYVVNTAKECLEFARRMTMSEVVPFLWMLVAGDEDHVRFEVNSRSFNRYNIRIDVEQTKKRVEFDGASEVIEENNALTVVAVEPERGVILNRENVKIIGEVFVDVASLASARSSIEECDFEMRSDLLLDGGLNSSYELRVASELSRIVVDEIFSVTIVSTRRGLLLPTTSWSLYHFVVFSRY